MAANNNKKTTNTSKTAHVMNLLSKNREPAPAPSDEPHEASSAPAAAAAPTILSSINEDSAISSQIKDALEDEIGEPAVASVSKESPLPPAQQPSEPDPAPAPEADIADDIHDIDEDEFTPITEIIIEPEPEAVAEETVTGTDTSDEVFPLQDIPALLESSSQPVDSSENDPNLGTTYVNVMQALVEEMVEKYMAMFQICTCARCKADVKALALNNLQPKYVVMRTGEMIPRITVYENKYSAAVIAQILHACKQVMENPRHDIKN